MEELSRLEALGMAGAALIVEPGTFPQTLGTGIAIEFEKARNSFWAFRVKLAAEMVRTNASHSMPIKQGGVLASGASTWPGGQRCRCS
jgi:hypothetical protein